MIQQFRRRPARSRVSLLSALGLVFLLAGAAGATTWTVNVGQGGFFFVDQVTGTSTSKIVVGDTVHWVWVAGTHSSTSGNSSTCTANGTWTHSATAPATFNFLFTSMGTFTYYCSYHCIYGMKGTVVVSPPPTVATVSPSSGLSAGGTSVTVTGTGFETVGTTTVTFGGSAATGVSVVNSTTITCTTPVHAPGMVDVTVINPDLGTGTLPAGYDYLPSPAPVVTGVTPPSGPSAGGTAVTISGSNFQSGAAVAFGSNPASNVAVVDAATITATTPAGPLGPADVTVTNPDTQTGTLTGAFTFMAPTVSAVSPVSGPSGGGTAVTLTGTNFAAGAAATIVGVPATGVSVASDTQISAMTGAGSPGAVGDVVVTNSDGQSGTLPNAFVYDFLDVPASSGIHDFVVKIARNLITSGCGGGNYCPSDPVLRSSMAIFLLRGEHGSTYVPPAADCATYPFADVTCPSTFADYILQLVNEGITAGCGGGNYCPSQAVTRGQMAVFLTATFSLP